MIDNYRKVSENIRRHYVNAVEKHPFFCNQLFKDKPKKVSYAKLVKDAKISRDFKAGIGTCNMCDVLTAEIYEIFAACEKGNYEQAEYEVYDAIAVLLRALDVICERQ